MRFMMSACLLLIVSHVSYAYQRPIQPSNPVVITMSIAVPTRIIEEINSDPCSFLCGITECMMIEPLNLALAVNYLSIMRDRTHNGAIDGSN